MRTLLTVSRCALVIASLLCAGLPAQAKEFQLGYLTQADDARYSSQAVERGYPNAPAGRSAFAAALALDDAAFSLQAAGFGSAKVVAAQSADAAGLAAALDGLVRQGVRHIVLELPAAGVAQVAVAARGKDVLLVNAAAAEDALRGAQCAPYLLHTLPSHAMQADALAQLLAARKWSRPLLLQGTSADDQLLVAAFIRSAKRFGLKPVAQRTFKLSADPRERELGNVRLLTASVEYDAVVVLDAAGEFARELPYRTVLPRPVVGASGLTAQAWSAWYERNGGPQLNRRFFKRSGRAMGSYDWATWVAARALAEVAARDPSAGIAAQLRALKEGVVSVDGYKGQRLTFRAWDGQLRQPLLLAHGNGVSEIAPIEGFLHASTVLDTLGYDAPETACKTP